MHFILNSTPSVSAKQVVLFYRDFRGFSGGHLKVWDYFGHTASSPLCDARVAFSAESRWDASNPWLTSREAVVPWDPAGADILFLAGTDWRALPGEFRSNSRVPIINLIQHPRHAEQGTELRDFLKRRAIRICVSEEVAQAIKATGDVNGPVFTIPNAVTPPSSPVVASFAERATDLLICGLKAPELAHKAYQQFAGNTEKVRRLIGWIPREEYLAQLANAKVALFLPRPSEGFYLPALEGMACGAIVVCPDCVGNRSFCLDGVNCFRPSYDADSIISAARTALQQKETEREGMLARAQETFRSHSMENERASFLGILDRIDELWSN